MVILERPPGSGVAESAVSKVVEVCDEARVVAPLDACWRQLILVVLRERSEMMLQAPDLKPTDVTSQ